MNNTEREKELTTQINALTEERREVRQLMAEDSCPFKIGDRMINRHGEKAQVSLIKYSSFRRGYDMKVTKLKKNGELYVNSTHVYDWDKWEKE